MTTRNRILAAIGVVAILALAFMIGRWTWTDGSKTATVPDTTTPTAMPTKVVKQEAPKPTAMPTKVIKQEAPEPTSMPESFDVVVVSCPKGESTMLAPQGETVDGLFSVKDLVAPKGFQNIIFDGQLRPSQSHVFLVFGNKVPELTLVQGTWYAVCTGDLLSLAERIAGQKASRNPDLTIQVRDLRGGGNTLIKQIN